jgi:superfamily II RNA helicase
VSARPPLLDRVPEGGTRDPGLVLGRFLDWVAERGLEPYPEQEQAILALLEGHHVILATPTGSGKSLVATALHFAALCAGERSFYTAPTKALVSEKFFQACDEFGPEQVAMLTGDASINPGAPIVCCTAEVLSNMALRAGAALDAPRVCMDEFHYYADRARGVAWQVPLLVLERARFLLMSATLGNTAPIAERLAARTGVAVDEVHSDVRPVPLDFDYRETPVHETLEDLVARGRAPIYVVHFTHRECAEQAQALTSARLAAREERERVAEALAGFRFDTPFGKDLQRWLRFGIGVHHAGMLPRYRLLVERLAQRGLLRVICGTDTLGVGVNIPIRTVLFAQLSKYDGEKLAILPVREFKQIAGRAGRRGFDERGFVVAQAPEHAIEKKRRGEARKGGARRKPPRGRPAPRGTVSWNRDTFERLVARPPETLESRFSVSHGMLVNVLQRHEPESGPGRGYRDLIALVERSHESEAAKRRLRRRAAQLFRSLRRAGIVETGRDARTGHLGAFVREDLQLDFGLHHTLSLYVVEAVAALDPEAPSYPLEVLSVVEAVLESPKAILAEQVRKLRRELVARLKAEGVPYEERLREVEAVTHPQPEAGFLAATFRIFEQAHPWVGAEDLRPKSIAREIVEGGLDFVDYVREYALARSEGVLLRYLGQVHHTLVQTVPEEAKTEEVHDAIAYLRTLVRGVDSSLVMAWEALAEPGAPAPGPGAPPAFDLALSPRALAARVRAELHALVRALARGEWEETPRLVAQGEGEPWDAERFRSALAPFLEEYGELRATPEARQARRTRLSPVEPRLFDVTQTLVDPEGDLLWAIHGRVDLRGERDPEGPIVQVLRIGT